MFAKLEEMAVDMNFKQAFKLAIKSIIGSKMRSFLTMLGIIIGVASVIILISLIDGVTKDMTSQFESMGTNLINVNLMSRGGNRAVYPDQVQEFAEENPDLIDKASPRVTVGNATLKYGTDNFTTTCYGVNEYYGDISKYTVKEGRFIQYIDVERRQKVCAIGSYIANEYFKGVSPIGQQLKVNGETFTIISVIEEKDSSEEGSGDDFVMMPYTVATRLSKNARVGTYVISATSKEVAEDAVTAIKAFLFETYGTEDAYRVFSQSAMIEQINEMTGTLTLVMVGVAGISLLVGGIGIMNIMLVSVTERTREIGIRKSLGAKRKDIMSQFVIESGTTSASGGIVGIITGIGGAYLAGHLMKMTVAPSFGAILLAFGVSVTIGVTFGYFPALKAAKLNPIDALRNE